MRSNHSGERGVVHEQFYVIITFWTSKKPLAGALMTRLIAHFLAIIRVALGMRGCVSLGALYLNQ